MKKFTLVLLSFLLLPVMPICADYKDTQAPEISIKKNDIMKVEGDKFDYRDFFDVIDDGGTCRVASIGADNVNEIGEHKITIIAVDIKGNVSTDELRITVLSKEEAKQYDDKVIFYPGQPALMNDNFKELKGEADENALEVASLFLGMPGACNVVAQAFINYYYGTEYNIFNTYEVSYLEARPGDIIYYEDGGLGLHHYAVYLGGDSALHGNIYNTTVIRKVYMNYGSKPHFRRIANLPY